MGLKPTKIEGLEGSEVKVGTGCSAGAYETDAAGNGWEEEWTPRIRQGTLDECKLEGEAAAHRVLGASGPESSEDQGKGVRSCVDTSKSICLSW